MADTIGSQDVAHSEFALEMILTKGIGGNDFSGERSDELIKHVLKLVKQYWDIFHPQEFDEKTKRANESVTYNSLGNRLLIGESVGTRGFYAKVEYIPPNAANILIPVPIQSEEAESSGELKHQLVSANLPPSALNKKAKIRVSIPLNQRVEGLESLNTTELIRIKEELSSAGYKPNVYKTWLPPQA